MHRKEEEIGLAVVARPGELPEKMIKRFMKKVRNDGIIQEVYQRRGYEKPGQKIRRKRSRAMFLAMIENRKNQL